ncbi:K02A2.6-like [Cordylochernes scorpioides]|uniref:RNA-directed DNA polymerase n=1 Tax=Cordylochernes scorpioides TaxID=51811 RepID=A0ABY6KLV2_9ARAC|nr:K02A2.6-like [Cordylochernes scorpioides]
MHNQDVSIMMRWEAILNGFQESCSLCVEDPPPSKPLSQNWVVATGKPENRSSWPAYAKDIFRNSTVNGVHHVADAEGSVRVLLWVIISCFCFGGFGYQMVTFMMQYRSYPTVVEVKVENNGSLAFPSVTICNSNRFRKSVFCTKYANECSSDFSFNLDEAVLSKYQLYSIKKSSNSIFQLGHQFKDFVLSCSYSGEPFLKDSNCTRVVNGIGKKREAESNGQKFQVDRPRPVRTPATVSKVKRLATTENPPSQRQLSRMCGTSLKTINNIIHKDLELDTRRKGKVHKLIPFHMKNRATNARKLYEEHLAGSRSEYTATLDEAWMYVTYCNGIRKICYIKRGNQVPDNWVHQCSETFPKGFMVVGVMTGRGVLPLIKVPSKVKVNSEFYIECVLKPVIEQLKDLYPGEMDKVFLHHDKASSHTSNKTQQFLQEMKDTLGLNFIRNSDIPVKSPDASPLDFYGFGMLKQRLFNRRPKTEAGLWKAAQEEWSNISLSKVKEVRFHQIYDPDFGNCYTMLASTARDHELETMMAYETDIWQSSSQLELVVNVENDEYLEPDRSPGFRVTLHLAEEIPDCESDGVEVGAGQAVKITVQKKITRMLPAPYQTNCTQFEELPWTEKGVQFNTKVFKKKRAELQNMENIKPPAEFVPYNGEKKWETWREAFEIFSIAADLESMPLVRQRAILKHIIGEKTMSIYKTFRVTENEAYPSIKEMLDMLSKHFKPFKNIIQIRNKFFTSVQKEGQGITEFVTELKQLALECEFEELAESLIRDRFIIGMIDQEVKKKLLEDPQLTLPKAISVATIAESVCLQIASWEEKQAMIEKINKNTWEKNRSRVEKAKAGPSIANTRNECKWCGQQHTYGNCPAYRKTCNACGKLNHFAAVCRTKRIRNLIAENEGDESFEGGINVNKVLVKTVRSDKWSAVISINGNKTSVHLDTGAQINVLPQKVISLWPAKPIIKPTSLKAYAYGHSELPIVGKCEVLCQYGEKKSLCEFIIADVDAQTLTTGDTCEKLEILKRINQINSHEMILHDQTKNILEQFHEVFQGVGVINSECKMYTKPEYPPVRALPRRIPASLGNEVQSELEKMVKQGIITKIYHETEWSHPMVVVKKKSGQIRICLDPRKLNQALIPKADYYTVFDVKSAYWHVPVANECRDLLVMATPFGKFRYNRLPFGLNISAQIFVEMMTNIFKNSFRNVTYVDDLLIYADSIEEHNEKLKGILEIARRNNIKFDLTKAQICKKEVSFVGHMISKNGIDPEPNKVDKVINLKKPEDKKSLQRIMGLYNYLGKFIPNLAASTSNIRGILKKNVVWHWGPRQDIEFHHIKECVRKAPSLGHYDKTKTLVLQCDASKDAMGAALLQENRPLAFASASFNDSQKQYSQIEKELLSIYYGCKKFEYLLLGHTFIIQTDHQPLLPLIQKPLTDITPRLQRIVMKLFAFDFKLQYRPGKCLIVADTLSRETHPIDELPTPFLEDRRMVKLISANISDEKLITLQKDTREDTTLLKIIRYVIEGWPIRKKDVDEDVKPYYDFRHRIYLWNELLCVGSAIVVPGTQRNYMLELLHKSHQGISAIQGLARESLFWPGMSMDIAERVKSCDICQKYQKSKTRETLRSFPIPDYPWQTVSMDIFYIERKPHLLIVDRFSGYPEVYALNPPTATNVRNKLRETFARFGIPETIMSDNGPPFHSEIMTDFCTKWGIRQIFSSPHLHRSNGLAERNIQTINTLLNKCKDQGSDAYLALLTYRNTPKNDLPSPAQLCLSRSLRCLIPRITPLYGPCKTNQRHIENAKKRRQNSMKKYYDRSSKIDPKVSVGEEAWCQLSPK